MPFKYANKLQDKRILVFGGSSGFGLAIAEASIEHGAIVALISSNADKLAIAAEHLKKTYEGHVKEGQISTFAVDLTLPRDELEPKLEKLFTDFTPNDAKIDHVVFTAGDVPYMAGLDDLTAADFAAFLSVRSVAPTIIAAVLSKGNFIVKSASSSITLTSGTSAHRIEPNMSPIAPLAGSAVEGLTRGLAVALAPIRVNIVIAGIVETPLLDRLPPEIPQKLAEKTVLKKVGKVEDTAEAYLYFMKDCSATGASVVSDGGQLIFS